MADSNAFFRNLAKFFALPLDGIDLPSIVKEGLSFFDRIRDEFNEHIVDPLETILSTITDDISAVATTLGDKLNLDDFETAISGWGDKIHSLTELFNYFSFTKIKDKYQEVIADVRDELVTDYNAFTAYLRSDPWA